MILVECNIRMQTQEDTYCGDVEMGSRLLKILEDADTDCGDCKESDPLDTIGVEFHKELVLDISNTFSSRHGETREYLLERKRHVPVCNNQSHHPRVNGRFRWL